MRKLKKYKSTKFMAKDSYYDSDAADFAVMLIESLCHTKGNIFIKTDPAGKIKADKETSTGKIDGAVAAIMALDRAIRCGNVNTESVYEVRGILFL